MQEAMVTGAQDDEIGRRVGAPVGAGDDMMDVDVPRRAATGNATAALVAVQDLAAGHGRNRVRCALALLVIADDGLSREISTAWIARSCTNIDSSTENAKLRRRSQTRELDAFGNRSRGNAR